VTGIRFRRPSRRALAITTLCLVALAGVAVMPANVQETAVNIAAVTGFYAGLVFVGGYHLLTGGKWRDDPVGVNIMLLCSAVTGLFALRCLTLILGDGYPGQRLARLALFAATAAALIWRSRIMIAAQFANLLPPDRQDDDVD